MTQGIQFSTMLTSADSALKPAPMQAEGDAAQSGFGFGAVLGELVQPATNSQSDTVLRKLPAGISLLSDASLMLPQDAEGASTLQPDNAALLSDSILYQIALKDKYAPGSGNTVLPVEGSAFSQDGQPFLLSDNITPAQAELDAQALTDTTQAVTDGVGKAGKRKIAAELVDKSGRVERAEPVLPGVDKVQHGDTAGADGNAIAPLADDAVTTDTTKSTAQAASAGSNPADGRFNVERKTAKDGPVTLVNQGRVERAIPVPPDSDVLQDNNADGSATLTGRDAVVAGGGADNLALQGVALQQQASAAAGNQTATDTKADTKTPAEKAAASSQTGVQPLAAQSALGAATPQDSAVAAAVVNVASQQSSKTADAKADKAKAALSSVSSGAPASNLATATTPASAEQLAQQQQRAAGQADNSAITAELGAAVSTKTVAEQANSRADSLFATSLHSAQQRQQNSAIKTATKTPAEQLKQSLNLLQHDAAGQLRERVNLMLRQNIPIAEIRLDPAGLGQMQIKVDMQQDQANVQFIVQQSQAKELLEQQLPRLREMLQQQGIVLGEGSVQQQSQQERQLADRQQQRGGQAGQHADNSEHLTEDTPVTQVKVGVADRLVDYYA